MGACFMQQLLGFLLGRDLTASHFADVKLASGYAGLAGGHVCLLDGTGSADRASMTGTMIIALCVILRKIVPHFPSISLCLELTVGLRWQAFSFAPAMNQAPAELVRPL
jgi:hypothetical protein